MVTLQVSQQQYCKEKAQQALSTADRLTQLTAGNERLDSHAWTDEQLRSIPTELLEFAWQQSGTLRKEFGTYETFVSYWKSIQSRTSERRHK